MCYISVCYYKMYYISVCIRYAIYLLLPWIPAVHVGFPVLLLSRTPIQAQSAGVPPYPVLPPTILDLCQPGRRHSLGAIEVVGWGQKLRVHSLLSLYICATWTPHWSMVHCIKQFTLKCGFRKSKAEIRCYRHRELWSQTSPQLAILIPLILTCESNTDMYHPSWHVTLIFTCKTNPYMHH